MICLTGDLHHASLRTGNQLHCDLSEIRVAQRYTRLLEEAGVHCTFFVSGKSFVEEWDDLKPIVDSPRVEIGGHNYDCFQCQLFHRACKKVFGSYNGPLWWQTRDARKTIEAIRRRTGRTISSWRNHMYMHGPHTERALAACGIQLCSDGVKKASHGPEPHPAGIVNLPINILPDHEHLYHAERTPEWVSWWVKRYQWSDDFGPQSYYIDEWAEHVLEGLRQNEAAGRLSTLIIHPITMYLCDRMRSFERLLEYIATRPTIPVSALYTPGAGSR